MDDVARIARPPGAARRVAGQAAALLFGAWRLTGRRARRPQGPSEPRNEDTRSESTDAPLWGIGLLAGIAVSLIALAAGGLLLVFPHAVQDQPKALTTPMPAPTLQTDPAADMRAYRAEAERRLHSYGWVDRDRGIARVPIEDAMRHVAERGIPDWPGVKR